MVATPVTWDEVEAGAEDPLGLEQFRYDEVLERVAGARRPVHRLRPDPARYPGSFTIPWIRRVCQSLPCLT